MNGAATNEATIAENTVENITGKKLTMRQHRMLLNLTQEAAAQKMCVSKSTYVNFETGKLKKDVYVFAFAGAFNINVDNIQL